MPLSSQLKDNPTQLPLSLTLPLHGAVMGLEWTFLDGFYAYNNRLFVVLIFIASILHIAALGRKRHLYFKEHHIKNSIPLILLHIFLMVLYIVSITMITELFFL